MPKKTFRPPEHLIEKWPEVFEDLHIDTMPVAYMDNVKLVFSDGRIWEIDIKHQLSSNDPWHVAEALIDILEEYQSEIIDIDFDIDVEKLKIDVEKETKNLL